MPPPLTLKELMQLAYNAGREDVGVRYWGEWWEKYGEDRHDDYEHWKTYGYDRHEYDGAEGDRTIE